MTDEETPEQRAVRLDGFWRMFDNQFVQNLSAQAPGREPRTSDEVFPCVARQMIEAQDPEPILLDAARRFLRNEIASERRRIVRRIAERLGADRRQLQSYLEAKGIT